MAAPYQPPHMFRGRFRQLATLANQRQETGDGVEGVVVQPLPRDLRRSRRQHQLEHVRRGLGRHDQRERGGHRGSLLFIVERQHAIADHVERAVLRVRQPRADCSGRASRSFSRRACSSTSLGSSRPKMTSSGRR